MPGFPFAGMTGAPNDTANRGDPQQTATGSILSSFHLDLGIWTLGLCHMPCFVGCLAFFFPRLAIILVWLFGHGWLEAAYQNKSVIWPVLGFFLLPMTVLAYALAWHRGNGQIDGFGIAIIILAVLIDLGTTGSGASNRKVRQVYIDRRYVKRV